MEEFVNVGLPVMQAFCKTCPFKPNKRGFFSNPELANDVISRIFLKGFQVCHGTEGKNREPTHKCKGAFDYTKEIYDRLLKLKKT